LKGERPKAFSETENDDQRSALGEPEDGRETALGDAALRELDSAGGRECAAGFEPFGELVAVERGVTIPMAHS